MSLKLKTLFCALQNKNISKFKKCSLSSTPEVDIPKRIPRGPTDILKAISSTYQRDPTASHYKYHDDPYLIPYSNSAKRSYALSQESGRKAAKWIRQQHSDLFQHKVADPMIDVFAPNPVYTDESNVNEEILLKLISSPLVTDAITVYNILKKKGIELKPSSKLSFLECICYFNSGDPISEDLIEERWYRSGGKSTAEKPKNTWKHTSLLDELFKELKDTVPSAYSALICGMASHGEIDKAVQVYEEARSKQVPLNIEVYNVLLSNVHSMKESHEMMWELIQGFLMEIEQKKLQPNVGTLNGVLETLSKMLTYRQSKKYALQTLSEFKQLGVEPCLASFYFLLEIFQKDKAKLYGVMIEILNIMEQKTFIIQDPKDIMFFVRAMEFCCHTLRNKDVAYRLHDVLLKDDNYNFIGDSYKESLYYRNFFFVLCQSESLSKVMEIYDELVPGVYVPEPAVINTILNTVYSNMAWELLPKLWSDIVLFEQAEMSGVIENTLSCAANCNDASLYENLCTIAWNIWERVEGMKRERSTFQWTASMLGNAVLTLLKGGEKAKAHLVMDKLIRLGSSLMNEPPIEAMKAYIDCCIEEGSPDLAIKTIQYCDDVGFMETSQFAQLLNSSIELSSRQRDKLVSIVGEDCLKLQNKAKEGT